MPVLPDSPPSVTVDGHTLRGEELLAAGSAVADRIHGCPVVGVYATPTLSTVVAAVGALLAGVAFVPLPPDVGERELRHILADASVGTVLGSPPGWWSQAETWSPTDVVPIDPDARSAATWTEPESGTAMIMYTSGTTGPPKGRGALTLGDRSRPGQAAGCLGLDARRRAGARPAAVPRPRTGTGCARGAARGLAARAHRPTDTGGVRGRARHAVLRRAHRMGAGGGRRLVRRGRRDCSSRATLDFRHRRDLVRRLPGTSGIRCRNRGLVRHRRRRARRRDRQPSHPGPREGRPDLLWREPHRCRRDRGGPACASVGGRGRGDRGPGRRSRATDSRLRRVLRPDPCRCSGADRARHRTASRHRRPREVRFVDSLPRNAMGKIQKSRLE